MRTSDHRWFHPVGWNILAVGMSVLALSLVHFNERALVSAASARTTGSAAPAANAADPAAFQQLLHEYRTGRSEDAITGLAGWPVDELAAVTEASSPRLSSSDRMAAAILEAEVAKALLAVHRQKDSFVVIKGAQTLVHAVARAPFGEKLGEEPKRSWYYAVASTLVGFYERTEASALLEVGLKEFPNDPLLITARGTVSARHWDVVGFSNAHSLRWAEVLMDWKAKAIADYKRALELRPDLVVAKLRLGQMYVEAGREREAGPWLQTIDIAAATINEQYFAHLLLGRIAAKEHRLEATGAEYRKAYTIGRYQAACIAVSQLQETLDQHQQPAEMTGDCLEESEREDPWIYWRTKADPDALPHLRAEARGE
jgi:tetratricopeptide (TPR) repeat protein